MILNAHEVVSGVDEMVCIAVVLPCFRDLDIIFTGFPARTVKIREHQQLQQEISKLSVLVASQIDITCYHFGRFKVPP